MRTGTTATFALGAVLACGLLVGGTANAQYRDDHDRRERVEVRHDGWREHVDARHGHDRRYPDRGVVVRTVPRGAIVVRRGPDRYWWQGGVWYGWRSGTYVVVAAPIGVIVPVLPRFHVTLLIGGLPYYYANDTYYVRRGGGYEVVDEPPGANDAGTAPPPPGTSPDDVYAYPRNGQSEDRQARDRYECHRWAADQTGYDPTRSTSDAARRAEYVRAMSACLDARGYTVR